MCMSRISIYLSEEIQDTLAMKQRVNNIKYEWTEVPCQRMIVSCKADHWDHLHTQIKNWISQKITLKSNSSDKM
jgi:hypothetical protein